MVPPSITHSGSTLLSTLVLLPLIGGCMLFFVNPEKEKFARAVALFFACVTFGISLLILREFDTGSDQFQLVEIYDWLPTFGIHYVLGVDGISIWLIVLTTFLSTLVFIASPSIHSKVRSYLGCMLLLETGMLGTFLALDGILFYVFWELMLIPMYFLIGVWGGERRIYAALKFVLYTALGSLLMLVAILYLGFIHFEQFGEFSFLLTHWMLLQLGFEQELWLFLAFALAFAIKIPLFPFHTWLPDAHVEAPTGGSVILAGVLLKMGLYGLIRFGMPVFPNATEFASPAFAFLGVVGIVYGALVAWVQTDIKKLVAYSSVSHLGFCVLGFATMSLQGMQGAMLQMLNHGISTGALFFLVGVLYDRKHSRQIVDYGGLAQKVPLFSLMFMLFTLSSVGLPLTNGFVGEFLILLAGFKYHTVLGAVAVSGVVLGAVYMLSLYRRVVFGKFDEAKNGDLADLLWREKLVFLPLVILVFVLGVYPQPVLQAMEASSKRHTSYITGEERGMFVVKQTASMFRGEQ